MASILVCPKCKVDLITKIKNCVWECPKCGIVIDIRPFIGLENR